MSEEKINHTAMSNYQQLRDKVDHQFERLFQKHHSQMACSKKCHQCCMPDLTVSRIEADSIHLHLVNDSSILKDLIQLESENPYNHSRCTFLNPEGLCSIYEVRPLVCRSHGVPHMIQIERKKEALDACELNFQDGLNQLDPGDWIHLETLNFLLGLINQSLGEAGNDRFALKASVLGSILPVSNS